MPSPKLVVLDFAGTTMKEEGAVIRAYREAFRAYDIPVTDEDIAARRGASKKAVFTELAARAGYPESVAKDALMRFESALNDAYASEPVQEIEGAAAVVTALRASGIRVALTSGFSRNLVTMLVGKLGWEELFDIILSGDDVPAGRPAPYAIYQAMSSLRVVDVATVAVAGDTPLDLQAGMNARAGWVIGVLSGAHGIETLGATPHTHLLPSVAELPTVF